MLETLGSPAMRTEPLQVVLGIKFGFAPLCTSKSNFRHTDNRPGLWTSCVWPVVPSGVCHGFKWASKVLPQRLGDVA